MITTNIQLILIVSGVATMGAIVPFFTPRLFLKLLFGVETSEPTFLLLGRHWGLLIFLIGALLVNSAYNPSLRDPVLVVAGIEKFIFSGLILLNSAERTTVAIIAATGDTCFALLYLLYFLGL